MFIQIHIFMDNTTDKYISIDYTTARIVYFLLLYMYIRIPKFILITLYILTLIINV